MADFGFRQWNRSVMTLYQTLRAARYLAISSKKSLCALKKKESLGANASMSSPARIAHSTYSMPSYSVNASSCRAVEPASVKQRFHVGKRIDRDAAFSDFALGHRMIRVITHQCRQMKRNGEPRLPVLQQIVIPLVGFLGRPEPAELPHRPQFAAVHVF